MTRQYSFVIFIVVVLSAFLITYESNPQVNKDFQGQNSGIVKNIELKSQTMNIYVDNVLIKSYDKDQALNPGDIISYSGKFKDVGYYTHKYDDASYTNYLKSKKVDYICYPQAIEISGHKNGLYSIRGRTIDRLETYIDNIYRTDSPIFKALVYGDRTELEDYTKTSFSHTGTSHILALSGFHVGIILVFINILLTKVSVRKRGLISTLILIIYGFLTGMRPSIVRAVVFFAVYYSAFLKEQRYNILSTAFVTAALLIACNPYYIYDAGFQLSFASVISIGMMLPFIQKYKIPLFIGITVSAQLLTQPIVIYNFGTMPLFGLCANFIIIPLISLLMVLFIISLVVYGLASLAGGFVIIGKYMVEGIILLKDITLKINSLFEGLPLAYMENLQVEIWKILLYYVIILVIYNILEIHTIKENKYEFEQLPKIITGE
ncbi:MAG: ComEC/Rec2 family competence protein [Proteocatella sp.]